MIYTYSNLTIVSYSVEFFSCVFHLFAMKQFRNCLICTGFEMQTSLFVWGCNKSKWGQHMDQHLQSAPSLHHTTVQILLNTSHKLPFLKVLAFSVNFCLCALLHWLLWKFHLLQTVISTVKLTELLLFNFILFPSLQRTCTGLQSCSITPEILNTQYCTCR